METLMGYEHCTALSCSLKREIEMILSLEEVPQSDR